MQPVLLSLLRPTSSSSSVESRDSSVSPRQTAAPSSFSEQHFALLWHVLAHTQSRTGLDAVDPSSQYPHSGSEAPPPPPPPFSEALPSPLSCVPAFLAKHLEDFVAHATPQGLAVVFSAVAKLDGGRSPVSLSSTAPESVTPFLERPAEGRKEARPSNCLGLRMYAVENAKASGRSFEMKEDAATPLSADLLLVSCCQRVFSLRLQPPPRHAKQVGENLLTAEELQISGRIKMDGSPWSDERERLGSGVLGKETRTEDPNQREASSVKDDVLKCCDVGPQECSGVGDLFFSRDLSLA